MATHNDARVGDILNVGRSTHLGVYKGRFSQVGEVHISLRGVFEQVDLFRAIRMTVSDATALLRGCGCGGFGC